MGKVDGQARALTPAQREVWIAQQLDPLNPRFNCGGYLDIIGTIDISLLERAITRVVASTDALCVRFATDAGQPHQITDLLAGWTPRIIDLASAADARERADAWMRTDLSEPVALDSAPLFTVVLFRLGPDRHVLYLRYHHIVLDGPGHSMLWRRFADVYTAFVAGHEPSLKEPASLSDLLREDEEYRRSGRAERDRDHWLAAMADHPEPAGLTDAATYLAGRTMLRRTIELSDDICAALRLAAKRASRPWSVVMLAAIAGYVHRLTGQPEILLGLPVSTRLTEAAATTPAMLANELPLRIPVGAGPTPVDIVREVSDNLGDLLRHQRYRGEDLRRATGVIGSPVVNVVSFDQRLAFGEAASDAHYLSSGPVRDLSIDVYGQPDGAALRVYFEANAETFDPETVSAHLARFVRFLDQFLAIVNAESADGVADIDLLTVAERDELVLARNATDRPYDLSAGLAELVARQADRSPDAVAVFGEHGSLTYRELVDAATRLAGHLRSLGVTRGSNVGVYAHRRVELVIALVAVLEAGAAYVPLDTEQPRARTRFQVDDAAISVVLTMSGQAGELTELMGEREARLVVVDELLPTLPPAERTGGGGPRDPAYVIYTSGSTGAPKGVVVPHRGVVNRLLWMQEEFGLGDDDCVLQKTPYMFDVSVWEFFWPLITGARLCVAEPGAHRDPRAIAGTVRRHGVTTLHFVPPMLDLFLAEPAARELTGLRRVVCSGEALRSETVKAFFAAFPDDGGPVLANLYGPTETSIDVSSWRCSPQDAVAPVPIGMPIANTRIYIVDAAGQPAPDGLPGEVCVGGVQVADGYLNRPELSAERFVPDRFTGIGRLYRTGDLARYRADGAIEFLGRLDHQVKIRGFRIELGEIEAALLAHPDVWQAVVVARGRDDGAERQLVGYVVPDATVSAAVLLDWLANRLPAHMIPAHLMVLDTLPLMPNGKVDRRSLPEPRTERDAGIEGPATERERVLHDAWCAVLGMAEAAVTASFFALGGDSMHGIGLRTELEQRGWTFTVAELFETPTIRTLAPRLRRAVARGRSAPFDLLRQQDRDRLPAGVVDAFPLTTLQAGMLFHADYHPDSATYRVVTSIRVHAPFDLAAVRTTVANTFRRHPALRSAFDVSSFSEPLQLVYEQVRVPLTVAPDLGGIPEREQRRVITEWVGRAKYHRFDVRTAPLVAVTVHPLGDAAFQLSVVEHHVVLDGWSDAVMLDEIVDRYRAALAGDEVWLPEVVSVFRDFVAEERRAAADSAHKEFWSGVLAGVEPTALPGAEPRSDLAKPEPRHETFDVHVSGGVAERLRHVARQRDLPLKAVLAAAHVAVLATVCGADEVVTGLIANGRLEEPDGDAVIGVFLNTLPLRVPVRGATLLDLATSVFEQERAATAHRRYPYAQMRRDSGGALYLDSYVNFMDFHRSWGAEGGSGQIVDGFGVAETDFPVAANYLIDPVHEDLRLSLDCDVSLMDRDFCLRLAGYYATTLSTLAQRPDLPLAELRLPGADEESLVAGWQGPAVDHDDTATVHSVIERHACDTTTALIHRDERCDHRELHARANRLARYLGHQGVRAGDRVGVSVPRGIDLVVALLAVLKAGASYVPLDPGFPATRLEFIAADARIQCLVTTAGGFRSPSDEPVVLLDADHERIKAMSHSPVASAANGDSIAYVIYTSGSTGTPKGTLIRHGNVVNFFAGMDSTIGTASDDVLLAVTSVSFDISVLELLWPLARGAAVVVADDRMIDNLVGTDGFSFAELCGRHRVTMLQATPSFLAGVVAEQAAVAALRGARAVLVGGEAFPQGLAQRLLDAVPGTRILNMYGPTETTIWSTVYELVPDQDRHTTRIPIGRPIANTTVLVVGPDGARVPIGATGELWIGGAGVGAGYLGRADLTAQRFVTHADAAGRLYRTGDRVRWRGDGVLEFLGRIDRQVKIRGHRIEPDEVESVLSAHPGVGAVAVVAVPGAAGPDLVAFVEPSEVGADVETAHVRQWGDVWDGAYRAPDDDFAGWRSSYTGQPIPAAEMREWLAGTIARIEALRPRGIVDVGVGVGLYLRHFATRVTHYHGFDVSATALRLAGRFAAGSDSVLLIHGDATRIAELPVSDGDVVLFNSVVQYFPGPGYLRRALTDAVRIAGRTGAVFVGDVRDVRLLRAFRATVALHRAPARLAAPDLAATVDRHVADERELCLAAEFFTDLAGDLGVSPIREIKRGPVVNELTTFRHDVTLLGPDRPDPVDGEERTTWSDVGGPATVVRLLERLPKDRPLRVTGVPNSRLVRPLALLRLLDDADPDTTAWDLRRGLWEIDDDGIPAVEDIARLGDPTGRPTRLIASDGDEPATFDVLFQGQE
jgi:amino acid adenylation domain-containing protein